MRTRRTRKLPVILPREQWRVALAWARNGSHLAVNRKTKDASNFKWSISSPAGKHQVMRQDNPVIPFGWSTDNSQIAVAIERGSDVDIGWVSVDRGSGRVIKSVVNAAQIGRSFSAVLAPDSKQIAFTRFTNGRTRDIYAITEKGEHEVPLVEHAADDCPLGYTPEMRSLLFASDRSGGIDLWSTPVSADPAQPLVPTRILGSAVAKAAIRVEFT